MQKIISKKGVNKFLEDLIKNYELIAPVKEKNKPTRFKVINNNDDIKNIYFGEITLVPPKEFFIPENETILEFKGNKFNEVINKSKKRIIFGLRRCDINAILVLKKAMPDKNFIERLNNTVIIGIHCDNPDKYCFCDSMELKDEGYDLFFYPERENYYVSIKTKKGEELVKNLRNSDKEVIKEIKNKKELISKDIDDDYNNKIWNSDVDKCLSCAACTAYCPTCNCFDIKDISDLKNKEGKRFRNQASCQLKSFSRVAGGRVFRESRESRFKHFIYHKIVYFKKKFGVFMCVGCGRCLRVCPTKIDWVNTINTLKDFERIKNKKGE